ncbi:MAG TPA: hypothetical protein VFO03_10950 [Gaiellaceae bacterium]|nr:hypothetical protein [Gaiellaceae bacterium]
MVRVKGSRVEQRVQPTRTRAALGVAAVPAAQVTDTNSTAAGAGVMAFFGVLVALGFLVLGVSAVPPRRVPWPVVAEPLIAHRSDLATFGIGTIALALLCLNIAILL